MTEKLFFLRIPFLFLLAAFIAFIAWLGVRRSG